MFSGLNWKSAPALVSLIFVVFFTAQVQALLRGLEISCGCFGSDSERLSALTALRTVSLAIAAILVWVLTGNQDGENNGATTL